MCDDHDNEIIFVCPFCETEIVAIELVYQTPVYAPKLLLNQSKRKKERERDRVFAVISTHQYRNDKNLSTNVITRKTSIRIHIQPKPQKTNY